jgi:hypothetical protein
MSNTLRWTPEQFEAHLARQKAAAPVAVVDVSPKAAKPAKEPETPLQRMQALGRLKQGEMNKTEARYAAHLEQRKARGEIVWFKFEGLKFRLADNTFLTPDFIIMLADGHFEAHDVKGFMTDDSNVKMKVAADIYPIPFFVVRERKKKDGGGWDIQGVGNGS